MPDGKPTVTMAYNTSSTSIHISWRAPHKSTIHGEFLGYRISYRPREKGDDEVKEIYIRDSNVDVRLLFVYDFIPKPISFFFQNDLSALCLIFPDQKKELIKTIKIKSLLGKVK